MGQKRVNHRNWRRVAIAITVAALVLAAFQAGVVVGSASVQAPLSGVTPTPSATGASVPAPTQAHDEHIAPKETPAATPMEPPGCRYGHVTSIQAPDTEWAAIVLDTEIRLDRGYVPPDLVDTSVAGLNGGHLVRAIMIRELRALARAARKAGAALAIQSSYRSFDTQRTTFNHWVAAVGRPEALLRSARPGHSEHQLGIAIDFRSADRSVAPWEDRDWAQTDAGAWLAAHAWRYGFVMSYPRGATSVSCYAYERWHYRYFGRDVAARIRASRLPARHWLLETLTTAEASTGWR